jgi:formylglycine-generating enzyme required for sulfatase activity
VGWYLGNSDGRLHRVAEKQANPFGFFDMHGNVLEWCLDAFEDYATNPRPRDGLRAEPVDDAVRVARGGAWPLDASDARSASRAALPPSFFAPFVGFRPALLAP